MQRCHWRMKAEPRLRCMVDAEHSLLPAGDRQRHIATSLRRFSSSQAEYDPKILEVYRTSRLVICECGAKWTDTISWLRELVEELHKDHVKTVTDKTTGSNQYG